MNKESFPQNMGFYGKFSHICFSRWWGVLLHWNQKNTNHVRCTFFTAGRWGNNIMLLGDQVGPSWRHLAHQFIESWYKCKNKSGQQNQWMKLMGYCYDEWSMVNDHWSSLLNFLRPLYPVPTNSKLRKVQLCQGSIWMDDTRHRGMSSQNLLSELRSRGMISQQYDCRAVMVDLYQKCWSSQAAIT